MTDPQVFEVVTLFPALFEGYRKEGLIGKAIEGGRIALHTTDPRAFVTSGYRSVDDTPFGGGPGMVMQAEPVAQAIESIEVARGPSLRVLVTPSAPRFDQRAARELVEADHITFLCGRYEGIDDRVRESMVDRCYSIGDFVLNGGELAALVIIEAVARLRPGVLGNADSVAHESFASDLRPTLEHPQYTKPANWRGLEVPGVLQSGDHGRIERWRRHTSLARTWSLRPDLRGELAPRTRPVIVLAVLAGDFDAAALAPGARARTELEAFAEVAGLRCVWVGGGGPRPTGFERLRALRDLRRDLRRSSGMEPVSLRLWVEDPAPPDALSAQSAMEAFEREDSPNGAVAPWILLLRFGSGGVDPAYEGTFAPSAGRELACGGRAEKDRAELRNRLANEVALIDISQPAGAREGPPTKTARAVADALDGVFGPR